MITCPACGTQNAAGSNFCIACGVDLTATATDERLRTDFVAAPTIQTPPLTSPSVDIPAEYLNSAPPPPPPPPAPTYIPPVYNPSGYAAPAAASAPARKERSLALILEIVGGLFGLPGIGWIYSGQTNNGLILLVIMVVLNVIGVFVGFLTFFTSCFCSIPLILVVMGVSSFLLYNHTKEHPEIFGA